MFSDKKNKNKRLYIFKSKSIHLSPKIFSYKYLGDVFKNQCIKREIDASQRSF